jgi:hypothetical protein
MTYHYDSQFKEGEIGGVVVDTMHSTISHADKVKDLFGLQCHYRTIKRSTYCEIFVKLKTECLHWDATIFNVLLREMVCDVCL